MARVGMQDVELDEESAVVGAPPRGPSDGRLRWKIVAVAVAAVVALGAVGVQLVADLRERAAVARLADVPGVLAPIDDGLPVAWRSDSMGDLVWYQIASHGAAVGPVVDDDGSQHLVSHDLATGTVRWSTELYGPDPARAAAEADLGASPPLCVPTTEGPDPSRIACLASDGFVPYSSDGTTSVPATASFVRVVDTADGRIVAEWPTTGASLVVLDDVAVLASFTDSYGALALDGRDLLTGESRWVAHLPAATDGASSGVTSWPPNLYRAADCAVYTDYHGRPALFDADGRPVHPELDGGGGTAGQVYVESVSGRIVFSTWSDASGYSSSTLVDGDGPGYSLPGSPYVPTVDDGSVPGLLLFFAHGGGGFAADGSAVLHGADVGTGAPRWTSDLEVSTDFSGAMILRGRVVVATTGGLAAVDGRSGRTVWSVDAPGEGARFSTPMTDGRHLLVSVQEPGDPGLGELVALDPASGGQVWSRALPDGVDYLYQAGDALLGLSADSDGNVDGVVRIG